MAGTGGKRAGAGRKKGSPNRSSVARQEAVAKSGATPLDAMIRKMRHHLTIADQLAKAPQEDGGKGVSTALDKAHEAAKDAAPYVHPRISATEDAAGVNIKITVTKDDKGLL